MTEGKAHKQTWPVSYVRLLNRDKTLDTKGCKSIWRKESRARYFLNINTPSIYSYEIHIRHISHLTYRRIISSKRTLLLPTHKTYLGNQDKAFDQKDVPYHIIMQRPSYPKTIDSSKVPWVSPSVLPLVCLSGQKLCLDCPNMFCV